MNWFGYALTASILWGLSYAVNQYVLKRLSFSQMLFFECLFAVLVLLPYLIFSGQLKDMVTKLYDLKLLSFLFLTAIVYLIGISLIYMSISASNASLAATIEATYPVFTIIFAYLILGEIQFTVSTLIGTGLVLAGITIINLNPGN